ncbi:large ribosomal subunit protein mL40-like [Ylistrum balloti]|uniref:large ribosomal subunit protein mL40-like n=1 Tax=Ylistrum balloti TaxID=509963 RepID=UPI002905AC22|nr:large ribosomal subunit protein mL40-like [Ylistrum balloti]
MAAPIINTLTANFTRLGLTAKTSSIVSNTLQFNRCFRTQTHPLFFTTTDHLQKKQPIHIFNKRRLKRKKQIEKTLAKMDRRAILLKAPIKEQMVEIKLEEEATTLRKREPSISPAERKKEIKKFVREWESYCAAFLSHETHLIKQRLLSQQRALEELRQESEDLYQQAIAIDEDLYHFKVKRMTETPPIPGFQPIDGEYNDISIKYD